MSKISIVSIRRERNKELETAALLRARRRALGEEYTRSSHLHSSSRGTAHGEHEGTKASEEYSFDVVLSPEHIHAVSDHLKETNGEAKPSENGSADPANASAHPIIFRFNIQPPAPGKTLTSDDVCELLNISRGTLYRYVKEKQLNGFKIGSQLRFLKQDVYRFMDEHKIQQTSHE